jgi:hypothetical protein
MVSAIKSRRKAHQPSSVLNRKAVVKRWASQEETMKNAYCTSGSSPGSKSQPDFLIFSDVPHPTIYLLTTLSKLACAWVAEHIQDDAMWFGSSIVVEHRYAAALVAQIERDGLVVRR